MKKQVLSIVTALTTLTMMCSAGLSFPSAGEKEEAFHPISLIVPVEASAASIALSGKVHIQNIGDVSVKNFDTIFGTVGKGLRLEKLGLSIKGMSGTVYLQTHVSNIGWQSEVSGSTSSGQYIERGTSGQSNAIEAVKIWLGGDISKNYDIYYCLHCMDTGWNTNAGYMRNSEIAGTTGLSKRAEAIIISLQPKSTTTKYVNTSNSQLSIWLKKGDKSVRLSEIPQGAAVKVHQTVSGWAFVDYTTNGVRYSGWVEAKYLSTTKPQPTTTLDTCLPLDGCKCSWRSYTEGLWSFSEHRNGGSGGRNYHLGLDVTGSSDTVKAIMNGKVVDSGWNSANGYYITIEHTSSIGEKFYSFYAHLNSIYVTNNKNVNKGESIGVVGNTGSSSAGKHLHLAIVNTLWYGGSYWGYAEAFSGEYTDYNGVRYYSPYWVIANDRLPR